MKRRRNRKIVITSVIAAILYAVFTVCTFMQLAFILADNIECWRPSYARIDISEILDKAELSDDDYQTLYEQTGLTKIGVDRMLQRGQTGKNKIKTLQEQYFAEHTVLNEQFAPFVCTDYIENYITHCYLEEGDILVTSSTHFVASRMGHAGLVTSANVYGSEKILQSNAYGYPSSLGDIKDFNNRVNFMILRVKDEAFPDGVTRTDVAQYALQNLLGLKYDIAVGVLSNKNKISKTHCSHLVWYAYKHFGIDLDRNGGLVVTPKDLANSPKMELVQVFGLDPVKLWK
ncbi:MAG: hypothetical protein K2N33_02725 [Clostridia bacterium]|nr:hypothetical protein [Clostridia bacterium]